MHSPRVRTVLESAADPLVVDLGYGALPVTTLELSDRLRAVRPDVEVVGLEIDPHRVASAQSAARPGVRFAVGDGRVRSIGLSNFYEDDIDRIMRFAAIAPAVPRTAIP